MSSSSKAPIALFVYNRPDHTRQTIEALKKNEGAAESDLFIFSDGPKNESASKDVEQVRSLISGVKGFKNVIIMKRNENYGLARSIIEGVTISCEKYGKVIVLEDDLVTSPFFLRYMNDALEFYENEERVMHISGSTYPIGHTEDETFFLRVPLCWGWATWERAWHYFIKSDDLMLKFDRNMRRDFSFNDTYHYWQQLEYNKKGLLNTWFVYWYAALFLRNGLALFPGRSLVMNIGMDGSGVNSGINPNYDILPSIAPVNVLPITLKESAEMVVQHEIFFRKEYPPPLPLHIRIYRKILGIIGRLIPGIRAGGIEWK